MIQSARQGWVSRDQMEQSISQAVEKALKESRAGHSVFSDSHSVANDLISTGSDEDWPRKPRPKNIFFKYHQALMARGGEHNVWFLPKMTKEDIKLLRTIRDSPLEDQTPRTSKSQGAQWPPVEWRVPQREWQKEFLSVRQVVAWRRRA